MLKHYRIAVATRRANRAATLAANYCATRGPWLHSIQTAYNAHAANMARALQRAINS